MGAKDAELAALKAQLARQSDSSVGGRSKRVSSRGMAGLIGGKQRVAQEAQTFEHVCSAMSSMKDYEAKLVPSLTLLWLIDATTVTAFIDATTVTAFIDAPVFVAFIYAPVFVARWLTTTVCCMMASCSGLVTQVEGLTDEQVSEELTL